MYSLLFSLASAIEFISQLLARLGWMCFLWCRTQLSDFSDDGFVCVAVLYNVVYFS